MPSPRILPAVVLLIVSTSAFGETAGPSAEQLNSWIKIREQRVQLLRDEARQIDARIETRLDTLVAALKSISDSKDSRTKVARMKEETGKRLAKTVAYYDQKRAALREELRNPRLQLTDEEKRKLIAVFDARIEKRAQQVLELNKSMPTHEEHERYRQTGSGWWGTEYERNAEYEQNRRMTTKSNSQRDAIVKELDASIARLERQTKDLRAQLTAAKDPLSRKTLTEEVVRNEALVAARRRQRVETLKPSGTPTHTVALKEALDLDKAIKAAVGDLRRDFTTLFERYNAYLVELSNLHATEKALAAVERH